MGGSFNRLGDSRVSDGGTSRVQSALNLSKTSNMGTMQSARSVGSSMSAATGPLPEVRRDRSNSQNIPSRVMQQRISVSEGDSFLPVQQSSVSKGFASIRNPGLNQSGKMPTM